MAPKEITPEEIFQKIKDCPLDVSEDEKIILLNLKDPEYLFDNLRSLVRRIFDINERTLLSQSDATVGLMGELTLASHEKRLNRYNRRIKDPTFDRRKKEHLVIVAEGDSWFQFPRFVRDIIDWLAIRNPHYAIYSIAYGGDWMTNMIYDGKYVEELSIHRPDVFLLSGGGNDLVGSNRIAIMADNENHLRENYRPKYTQIEEILDIDGVKKSDKMEIRAAQQYVTTEFYSFLLVLELQYRKVISSINNKYPNMLILTQGYAFARPSYSRSFDFRYPLKFIINMALDNGKWLARPLRIKGIYDKPLQRAIIKVLIFELNLMLTGLAKRYKNLYHVNALEVPQKPGDWFDELHLKSHKFKEVAMIYEELIEKYAKNPTKDHPTKSTGIESYAKANGQEESSVQKVYTVHDIKK